jgi:hypothetical protein
MRDEIERQRLEGKTEQRCMDRDEEIVRQKNRKEMKRQKDK